MVDEFMSAERLPQPSGEIVVVDLGAEGGSVTVYGRQRPDGLWEFARDTEERALWDMLAEDEGRVSRPRPDGPADRDWHEGWSAAVRLLDRYEWTALFPLKVHPDFVDALVTLVNQRTDDRSVLARWASVARRSMSRADPLQPLECPVCRSALAPDAQRKPDVVRRFEDCLRRCEYCGVGWSNSRAAPVRIFENPAENVPAEVRGGLRRALLGSVNVVNRLNKSSKFGFETSEDAVTWTVFRHCQKTGQLGRLAQLVDSRIVPATEPALLLWGVPVPETPEGQTAAERLGSVCRETLREDLRRLSEPDVVLDCGESGLVVFEVKYRSGNDKLPAASPKWAAYTGAGFKDQDAVRETGLYELTRNWRLGVELAGGRPFALANLASPEVLKEPRVSEWAGILDTTTGGRFRPIAWRTLVEAVKLAPWADAYLRGKGLV